MEKNKIKSKPLLFILLLLVVGTVGGTFAYFYTEVVISNQFRTMTYEVKLNETNFKGTWGSKNVSISNNEKNSKIPVVIRFNYNEIWKKTENNVTSILSNKLSNGNPVVKKNWATSYSDFTLSSDGWYYYNKVLSPQETVKILESIEKDSAATSDYNSKNANYELDFNYEAIQADTKAIKKLWNLEATIKDDNTVTWKFN